MKKRVLFTSLGVIMVMAICLTVGIATTKTKSSAATRKDISSCLKKISSTYFYYTGAEIKPTVTVTDRDTSKKLVNGTDYTLTYSNNINVGTGTVTIKGKNSYNGSAKIQFYIDKQDLKDSSITVSSVKWTGSAQKPVPIVVIRGKKLTKDKDFTVSYKNNTNAGDATVTVKGKGIYKGSKTAKFHINGVKMSSCTYTNKKDSENTPKVTYDGKTLVKYIDFSWSISVKSKEKLGKVGACYRCNNYNVPRYKYTYKHTFVGKGKYEGTKTHENEKEKWECSCGAIF